MMGQDIDRMVGEIDAVREACMSVIKSLAAATNYQMPSDETHGGTSTAPCKPIEHPIPVGPVTAPITAAMGALSGDYGKMSSLESSHFEGSTSWNNCIGSPYKELHVLKECVEATASYDGPLDWVGWKAGMLAMVNMTLAAAVDAKWAVTYYHDYSQRGFDSNFNGNRPSITWQAGLDKQTIGNVEQQKYDENVVIPTPPLEPF